MNRGAASRVETGMERIIEKFCAGGPVMWPILALSVLGLAVVFDRAFAFKRFFASGRPQGLGPQAALNRLQRGFGLLSTIITAEPMLGILGTVTGIIRTFGSFDTASAGAPSAATAGIGEALITTAAGLAAALVLLFPYNILLGMLSRAAERLENENAAEA